jgi:prolyl 4-hydroxylase
MEFVPRGSNALFWVNLYANGTGDERTVHAGLPLLEGRKTAMNIQPRKFYGRGER